MDRGVQALRRAVLCGTAIVLIAAAPAPALPFSWTGQSASANFSNPSNWIPGSPLGQATSLTFGKLPAPCSAGTMTPTCYFATNDVSGLSVDSVSFDTSQPYHVSGDPVRLGAGGLTVSDGGGNYQADFSLPLALTASQTWSITGPFGDGAPLTGTGSALTVNFNSLPGAPTFWFLYGHDSELGALHVNGPGQLSLGGSQVTTSLNSTDGNPLSLAGGAQLFLSGPAETGPLSSTARVDLSTSQLTVVGSAALGGTVGALLQGPGSGQFGTLDATGPVTLGGRLDLEQIGLGGPGTACGVLPAGTTFTILSAGGPLTGTFVNAPPGALLGTWQGCPSGGFTTLAQISYTPHTVVATVVVPPTLPAVQAVLAHLIKPKANQTKVGYLLSHGGFPFAWPQIPGLLWVYWHAKVHGKQTLIAVANAPSFDGAQPAPVLVKLTKAGRRLFKRSAAAKVSADGLFLPAWYPRVELKAHATFTFKR